MTKSFLTLHSDPVEGAPIDAADNYRRCHACGDWVEFSDLGSVLDHARPLPYPAIKRMKQQLQLLIYTILADDMPIAALEATGSDARELCKERWFIEELSQLKRMGKPLYQPGVHLRARVATEENGSNTTRKPVRQRHRRRSCSSIWWTWTASRKKTPLSVHPISRNL
jgi:hypothetical protein